MRTVGSPRRALTVLAVPAHSRSSPAPRSRRARNHGARLTLRHRAASIAGEFVRGPRPLALRTSSWWTKNSLRLGKRRTQLMRKKPRGGPDRIVATSQGSPYARVLFFVVRRSGPTRRGGRALVPRGSRARGAQGAKRDRASSTGPGGSVRRDRVHRTGRRAVFARWRRRADWPCRRSIARAVMAGFVLRHGNPSEHVWAWSA